MKFAKAGTTASKRASERRFRPPLIPTEGTGESERCGTIFRRIEFSAVRVGARVRGGRAIGGYCTHSTLSYSCCDGPSLGYLCLPRSSFFIPPRLPAATHSRLPSPFPPYFAILSPPLRSLKRIIVRGIKLFPSPICTSSSSPFPVRSRRSLSRLVGRFCAQPFLEAAGCTGNYYRSTSPQMRLRLRAYAGISRNLSP